MAKYDGQCIEVVNWGRYNPRTDSKKPSWFRLENTLATGSSFFGLDCEQRWLWVFICSLMSQSGHDFINWSSRYCETLTGIAPDKQDLTIDIFVKFVRLRVSRKVTKRVSPATNERTDERIAKHALVDLWNQYRGKLPEVRGCSGRRKSGADARWEEKPEAEYWTSVIKRLSESDFCCGKNDRSWMASFDFLIRPDTQHKVLEGKYDNRGGTSAAAPLKTFTDDGEVVDVPTQ